MKKQSKTKKSEYNELSEGVSKYLKNEEKMRKKKEKERQKDYKHISGFLSGDRDSTIICNTRCDHFKTSDKKLIGEIYDYFKTSNDSTTERQKKYKKIYSSINFEKNKNSYQYIYASFLTCTKFSKLIITSEIGKITNVFHVGNVWWTVSDGEEEKKYLKNLKNILLECKTFSKYEDSQISLWGNNSDSEVPDWTITKNKVQKKNIT